MNYTCRIITYRNKVLDKTLRAVPSIFLLTQLEYTVLTVRYCKSLERFASYSNAYSDWFPLWNHLEITFGGLPVWWVDTAGKNSRESLCVNSG